MKLMHISDTHLGVKRSAGTTAESRSELNAFMLSNFQELLDFAALKGYNLLINGDLFDGFNIDRETEYTVFEKLMTWCKSNPCQNLWLSAGNHDLSRDSSAVSSFQSLWRYLNVVVENFEVVFNEACKLDESTWVIPHMPNQELFDAEIDLVLEDLQFGGLGGVVFVHANYDNNFAKEADHSLNVSYEVAKKFKEQGATLVFAHEHQSKKVGNVWVVGNQFPSSISDCLGNDTKYFLLMDGKEVEMQEYLDVTCVYQEVDWRSDEIPSPKHFIRITGQASSNEASEVVNKIIHWRKTLPSSVFVLTNAVVVESMETELSKEDLQSAKSDFDITKIVGERVPEHLKPLFENILDKMN